MDKFDLDGVFCCDLSGYRRFIFSAWPQTSFDKFGLSSVFCHDLSVSDVCLPPDHAEVIPMPDLCDKFRRFEFSVPAGP